MSAPILPAILGYGFFLSGAWANAEAAAVFSAFVALGFCSVLLAAVAAFAPVCFPFFGMLCPQREISEKGYHASQVLKVHVIILKY